MSIFCISDEIGISGFSLIQDTVSEVKTNFILTRYKKTNELLKQINVTNQRHLTPKCKKLLNEALKLKNKNERLVINKNKFKSRMRLAEKFADSINTEKLMSKLNKTTLEFFNSQIKCQKKPKGRRYSLNDKILSLSLYKNSPKGYRFLSTYFALPSKKTLTNLLYQVPFKAGINEHIINNLSHQASKLKPNNRLCSLVFDEMALKPSLKYSKKDDFIFGFENFGKDQQTCRFSDHVLGFLLRGINRKWKQAVAYYFCQSTTKTPQLVKCIKEVITAIQSTGLQLLTTVCDPGGTNSAAIKILTNETKNFCLQNETENHYFGLVINNQEIIPMFDPPHLLKTMRNNLITKDCIFTKNNKSYEASWDHIRRLFEFDIENESSGLRTLPKLNESHVIPEKIKKTRVSVADQTISQRVAATLRLMADYGKSNRVY